MDGKRWPIEIARMTGGLDWTGLNERMELGCCGRKRKATKATSSNSRGGPLKVRVKAANRSSDQAAERRTSQKRARARTGSPLEQSY